MREEELKDTTVMVSLAIVIGASVVFVVLLIAVMSLAFYRYSVFSSYSRNKKTDNCEI